MSYIEPKYSTLRRDKAIRDYINSNFLQDISDIESFYSFNAKVCRNKKVYKYIAPKGKHRFNRIHFKNRYFVPNKTMHHLSRLSRDNYLNFIYLYIIDRYDFSENQIDVLMKSDIFIKHRAGFDNNYSNRVIERKLISEIKCILKIKNKQN